MDILFTAIYRFFEKRRGLYLLVISGLLIFSVLILKNIGIDDDIRKVVPYNPELEKTQNLLDNLKVLDKLLVVFSADDKDEILELISTVDSFVIDLDGTRIENVKKVKYQFNQQAVNKMYDFFYQNLPLFLDASDYNSLEQVFEPENLQATIERNYKTLISPGGIGLKKYLVKDPFSWTPIALKKLQKFNVGGNFVILNDRLFSVDQKNIFVFLDTEAENQNANKKLVDFLDSYKKTIKTDGIKMHYFGASPVAFANQKQIKNDIIFTVGITFLLVIILISLFFRSWKVFLNILSPVILGGALSLSFLILFFGEISGLALGVGSILLGITIDYALHIYTHLLHTNDKKELIKMVSSPILLSSITTAVAFVVLVNIRSEAFNHLAWFASISVVLVSILSLIMIPQQAKIKLKDKKNGCLDSLISKLNFPPKITLVVIVLVSIFLAFGVSDVHFDGDLLKLNYMTESLSKDETYINSLTAHNQKNIYLSSLGQDIEQALQTNEKAILKLNNLKKRGLISDYASISQLWHSQKKQEQAIKRWKNFWQKQNIDSLKQRMYKVGKKFNFNVKAFNAFFDWVDRDFHVLEHSDMGVLRELAFDDLITEKEEVQLLNIIKMDDVSSANIDEIYKAFEGEESIVVFDKQHFREILLDGLKGNFSTLAWASLLVVFIILLIFYGRIELAIINMLPILISWLWTIGLAGWLSIEFNIFNIIISSLIFGLGIDYSIAITRGMVLEYKTGRRALNSFRLSVFFSAITTLAGVGVLVFAKHPALKSMAFVTVIGIASVLLLSYTLIPILFRFLTQTKGKKRRQPAHLLSLVMSNVSMLLVLIAMVISVPFRVILSILPIPIKAKKYAFSLFLHYLSKWVVYLNFHIPKHLIGFQKGIFDKPSIVISNHQSQLDLVLLLMLHPKLIVVTNESVWNHRILKYFVRYADFYPISAGYENAQAHINKKMQKGYSVLIFPEGTRTQDGSIKRFRKGAFQLALDLKADVLPILIMGAYDSLSRHEFFLHSGNVYIQALDKIDLSDSKWGKDLREKTKSVQSLMRDKFRELSDTHQPEKFYRKGIMGQYLYKGPVLEWYAKIKTRIENNYVLFNNLIKKDVKIIDVGCGYGFLGHYLAKLEPTRTVKGFDYDVDKIEVAQKSAELMDNLDFQVGDITQGFNGTADVFILTDILHYMPPNMQEKALNLCLQNLNSGGMIIVRDANTELKEKHRRTKITEFLSTKIFRFNKTQDDRKKLYFINKETLIAFLPKNGVEVEILDKTKYLSNIIYLISKIS